MKQRKIIFFMVFLFCLFFCGIHTVLGASITERIAGKDRYETAIAISKDGWINSEYIVLASGEDFPDAICSTPLAKKYNAPILLTNKKELTVGILPELKRLGTKQAYIIGGTGVVSSFIEEQLRKEGITTTRLGGKDRYETAVQVAEKLGVVDKIAVVQARDYAGAVSIASVAANNSMPILLSDKNVLDPAIIQYLQNNNIAKSYIVGGEELLGTGIEKAVTNGIRLGGKDRYKVNLAILKEFSNETKFDQIYVTTGEDYPDALAASASAVKSSAPVVLANKRLLKETEEFINGNQISSNKIKLIGGEAVLPSAVAEAIVKKEPSPVPVPPESGKSELVVCIDAGDGINPNELVGPAGTKEKDVNLAVALKTGKMLEDNGIKVIYTRKSDVIPWTKDNDLEERFKIAEAGKANVFISIHCNVSDKHTGRGTETYYADSSTEGKRVASYVQGEIINVTGVSSNLNRGAKLGSQPELKGTKAIGVKIYLGFIDNSEDENNLKDEDFQNKCAKGILTGMLRYKNGKDESPSLKIPLPEDISANVLQGESYTLPSVVNLIQRDSTKKQVAVIWNKTIVDTNTPGVYMYEGRIKDFPTTLYLALTVTAKGKNNEYTICLDPGHGGYDVGAMGITGLKEKDITLPVALKTADILAKNGVKIFYTRISDNVVWPANESEDLKIRCDISNKGKPNYYVSVHINSYSDPKASGVETYYAEGNDKGQALANSIQTQLLSETGLLDRKIKTAGYYVLQNTDATSVLAELAFISNLQEEKLLCSEVFQNKCANAIANGILSNLK